VALESRVLLFVLVGSTCCASRWVLLPKIILFLTRVIKPMLWSAPKFSMNMQTISLDTVLFGHLPGISWCRDILLSERSNQEVFFLPQECPQILFRVA
jgi:hypothetical protein